MSDALATYDEVATQLQRQGHDARAVEVFRRIVDLDDTNPLPHLRLAEAYSRVKNIDDAIAHFGVAAEILLKLKRHDDAVKVLERLLHHRPDPAFARRAAEVYLERAKPNDGMLALAKCESRSKPIPESIETLAFSRVRSFRNRPAGQVDRSAKRARSYRGKSRATCKCTAKRSRTCCG